MDKQYRHYYFTQCIEGTEPKEIMLANETLCLSEQLELYCQLLKFIETDPLDYYLEYFVLTMKGNVVHKGMVSFASEVSRVRYEKGFSLVNMENIRMVKRPFQSKDELLRVELQFTCRNPDTIDVPLKVLLYGYALEVITSPFSLSEEPVRTGRIVPSKMNDLEEDPF